MPRPRGRPRRVPVDVAYKDDDVSGDEKTYDIEDDEDAVAIVPVVAEQSAPTMSDAFHILCEAMAAQLDDNLPAQMHCDTMQVWYQNGQANYVTCWRHAVLLLEGIVGASLRTLLIRG